ncbi:hypothetical protein AFLA_009372 [Aspergillus flavus NRRL3357]|nr:hypothetical protein AFLA_009372 [Aspergillus flavus NRRL3357]
MWLTATCLPPAGCNVIYTDTGGSDPWLRRGLDIVRSRGGAIRRPNTILHSPMAYSPQGRYAHLRMPRTVYSCSCS